MRWCTIVCLLTFFSRSLVAQTGTFTGVVTRDTLGTPLPGADVALSGVETRVRTDAQGAFRFTNVAAGKHSVVVRAVGFEMFYAQIDIEPGKTLDGDLTLTRAPVVLDTVMSVERGADATPPNLRDFESRRKSAATGQFITDSTLRAHDDAMVGSLVGMLCGAKIVFGGLGEEYLSSGRGTTSKPAFQSAPTSACLVTVYQDGIQIYPGGNLPDFGHMRVSDYSGVEYYASPAEAPAQYTRTGTGCGIVLLWTRQRRIP
jgi:hypothetical protein